MDSMKAPGTAYDNPDFGKDPQPDSMDKYVQLPNTDEGDSGGVHINSGIPNKAFYVTAGNRWIRLGSPGAHLVRSAPGIRVEHQLPGIRGYDLSEGSAIIRRRECPAKSGVRGLGGGEDQNYGCQYGASADRQGFVCAPRQAGRRPLRYCK